MRSFGIFLLAALVTLAFSCTEFRVKTTKGQYVIGRSMEFAEDLMTNVRVEPKGADRTATLHEKCARSKALTWTNKNDIVYFDALGQNIASDGLNGAGLSLGALYLPGFTKYQEPGVDGECTNAVSSLEFGSYILGHFESVAEIKEAIDANELPIVWDGKIEGNSFPLHFSIQDKDGNGIIIEFTLNGRRIFNNSLGIFTNSPTYDWHQLNIQNYVSLTKYNAEPLNLGGMKFSPFGQGSGLLGVPGDFTPPSRFIRTLMLLQFSTPVATTDKAANLAFHLMNSVDIPIGVASEQTEDGEIADYTQWIVVKDLAKRKAYIRGYNDLSIRVVDLNKLQITKPAKLVLDSTFGDGVVDITKKLEGNQKTEL